MKPIQVPLMRPENGRLRIRWRNLISLYFALVVLCGTGFLFIYWLLSGRPHPEMAIAFGVFFAASTLGVGLFQAKLEFDRTGTLRQPPPIR